MTKKTFSKVIAAVLVASLCLAAVFTGSVSAESATYTMKGRGYNPGTVGAGSDYVAYELTFTATEANAFTAGSFTVNVPSGLTFADCSAKTDSDGYTPNVYLNINNKKVLFAGFSESAENDFHSFTSLTLLLKFVPSTAAAGDSWTVSISDISITNTAEATYSSSGTASATAHIHNFTNPTTANGVTTKTCSVDGCDAEDVTYTPGSAEVDTNELVSETPGENHANLSFASDGDTVLNALISKDAIDDLGGTTYFVYKYQDDTPGYQTATSVQDAETLTVGDEEFYIFSCGKNGGIGRMGRDIVGNFVNVNGGTTTISSEWSYNIKSYLENIINNSNDLYTSAQQNYAKALWNFGYYTTLLLNEKYPGSFDADIANYSGDIKDVSDWTLPESFKAIGDIGVTGIDVRTGFKPILKIKLSENASVTVNAYTNTGHDTLIYKKTINAVGGEYFEISDIPAKYLTGDIIIEKGGDSWTYSFGRYAKRLQSKAGVSAAAKNAAKWMMNYSYYLGQAFGN